MSMSMQFREIFFRTEDDIPQGLTCNIKSDFKDDQEAKIIKAFFVTGRI